MARRRLTSASPCGSGRVTSMLIAGLLHHKPPRESRGRHYPEALPPARCRGLPLVPLARVVRRAPAVNHPERQPAPAATVPVLQFRIAADWHLQPPSRRVFIARSARTRTAVSVWLRGANSPRSMHHQDGIRCRPRPGRPPAEIAQATAAGEYALPAAGASGRRRRG